MDEITCGVVTLSDRARSGEYEDESGPAVKEYLENRLENALFFRCEIIPDEYDEICAGLQEMSDVHQCSLIITTGGTGPSRRDVTPEATSMVCEKLLPGFGEQMRRISLNYVPTAILSRQTAGIRGASLIVNLPGKPKAIRECLDAVILAIPDCVDLIGGPRIVLRDETAYRPHKS